jgi:soluble lytic murein transglycosylase-like protein
MNRFLLISLLSAATLPALAGSLTEHELGWADYYARHYGLSAELVAAVIDVESAWQPAAVSEKGAAGVMQLMPATAYRFGVTNRFDIEENIRGGVAYLAYLMRLFGGDFRLAVAAYYAGETPIRKLGLACADPNVYRYVKAVERCYRLRRMIPATTNMNSSQGEVKP